jgi:hypothetical protein
LTKWVPHCVKLRAAPYAHVSLARLKAQLRAALDKVNLANK